MITDILISYGPFVLLIFVAAFMFFVLKKGNYQGFKEREQILREGSSAEAEVISLKESSSGIIGEINDQHLVADLKLRVNQGGHKYEVTLNTGFHIIYLPRLQPGKIVKVKVDPSDQNKVALDFDAM